MTKRMFSSIRIILIIIIILLVTVIMIVSHDISFGHSHPIQQLDVPHDKMGTYELGFSSHLPILLMRTDVSSLHDRELPPLAVIWLFDNGGENRLTDTPAEVFDFARAFYRGSTSLSYPKKPYKINLLNYNNAFIEPLKHSFFGYDASSEWVLRPPYADKSLLRDWFSYELAAMVLDWQPRGKPVQLFLQDGESGVIDYQGVYFLCHYIPAAADAGLGLGGFGLSTSERIDFDGGGYLFQRDRDREYSNLMVFPDAVYRIMHPNDTDLSASQNRHLRNEIAFFHDFLSKKGPYEGFTGDEWDYWNYIDVDSFIDYFLIAEVVKVIDAGRFSTFMYRQAGGKLIMGPLWDCDLSMGNSDYQEPYYHSFLPIRENMISQLLEEEAFAARFVEKWRQYRSSIWSDEAVFGLFDEMSEYLAEPAAQNAERWPEKYDGQTYIWPNPVPYTESWEEEIMRTRLWLAMRLQWLDGHIPRLMHESAGEINNSYQNSLNG